MPFAVLLVPLACHWRERLGVIPPRLEQRSENPDVMELSSIKNQRTQAATSKNEC